MATRRDLLAAAAALPVLGQAQAPPAYRPRVFSTDELNLIRDLAETIIPRTETPGAADAKVELSIDRAFSARPAPEIAEFRRGLTEAVKSRKQGQTYVELLTVLSGVGSPFFRRLKDLTIDGYYSSREGLAVELGWHGYTALTEFKGCTHTEHQE